MKQHKPLGNQELGRKRSIYLLPNLFTTGALFGGFYAIVAGMKKDFEVAAIAIFIAMVMDTLDGRVARLTGTQSEFGAEYDSLSDMVSFGVAPALLVYNWGLADLGKLGWLVSFTYAVATALRLARFNVQTELSTVKNYFIGLPCPAAAAVVVGMVWLGAEVQYCGKKIGWMVALATLSVALLMVSNVPYYSFKEIDFKGKVPFVAVLMVVLSYVLIAYDPPKVLFTVFVVYAISGILLMIKHYFRPPKT